MIMVYLASCIIVGMFALMAFTEYPRLTIVIAVLFFMNSSPENFIIGAVLLVLAFVIFTIWNAVKTIRLEMQQHSVDEFLRSARQSQGGDHA